MKQLSAGQNAALPEGTATVVRLSAQVGTVDVFCLALGEDDRVRGQDDVAFYSNHQMLGGSITWENAITVRLPDLPSRTARLLFVAQADGVSDLGLARTLIATVAVDGTAAGEVVLDGPPAFPVVQVAEVYRHGGGWKIRALGDGYAQGMSRLLTVHGIAVDEAPMPSGPSAGALGPATPPPAPASPPPASVHTPAPAHVPPPTPAPVHTPPPTPTPEPASGPRPTFVPPAEETAPGDLVAALGLNARASAHLRSLLLLGERLYDAVTVSGVDKYRSIFSGAELLVTDQRVLLVRSKVIGKARVDLFPWAKVTDLGLAADYPAPSALMSYVGEATLSGQWLFTPTPPGVYDKGVTPEARHTIQDDRVTLLHLTMLEARGAYRTAEDARRGASVGASMDELRRRRGF